jgi:hypothetical protein
MDMRRVLAGGQESGEAMSQGTEDENDDDDDPEREVAHEAKEGTPALGKKG